ncbi:MAG TPA: TQO small subunit DoxD [Geminicoccaceae bacterium]|nr:TQO small subunit DoxD [Geminicoccaceae bacterium]
MSFWQRYWFTPAPCLDLAIVRLIAVATQLFWMAIFASQLDALELRAALPAENWSPLIILNLLNLPWGWGFRPSFDTLQIIYYVSLVAGILALIGFLTNAALLVFAATCVYLQAFIHSFNDFHHPEAVMMVALTVLALSPSGRVLSLDAWLARRRAGHRVNDMLTETSEFAGWPLKLLQWFFVLMYASAVWSKLSASGLDWANGFTLQYLLARDGLRWDSPFAYWLSHHHVLILLGQYGVLLFQATFALAVIFPKLRWIYVPAGLCLHIFIYLTLTAPFFQWIALYAVFIPWTGALKRLGARSVQMDQREVGVR